MRVLAIGEQLGETRTAAFDLLSPLADQADLGAGHSGFRKRGEPTPLAGDFDLLSSARDAPLNIFGFTIIHEP